jgi:hypothetical protein
MAGEWHTARVSIYRDAELDEVATCKEYLQVRAEGGRQVRRSLKHYNRDLCDFGGIP